MMWVGHQRDELKIRLDGKEIKQGDGFVYLGGMVTEDGHAAAAVRHRTHVGHKQCDRFPFMLLICEC